jgi:hypothetical protein
MSPHQTPRPEQPNFFRPRYYSKEQTEQEAPSVKAGMSLKKMANQRRQYVQLIIGVCKESKLGQFIACSAITFCHHFYLARTMQQNDPMLVALAAVFLASKSENHGSARLQQIIGWFFKIKYAKDKEMATKMFAMMSNPQQNEWLRDIVLKAERALLYVLGFRFQVDQPTAKLLQFATKYKLDSFYKVTLPNGPKLSQLAANFLNDMWETTLSLRHPANFLAAGALYCAIKITKTDVPLQEGGKSWYELAAGVTQQQMEVFDAELMQRYQPLPVDAKSGKRAAGKPGAGAKPPAANGTAGQGAAAAPRPVAPQHVPTAPGTPVSTGYAPAAAREHTPDDPRSGGSNEQRAAKRSRTDCDGAAAKQPRLGDHGNGPVASGVPPALLAGRTAPAENGSASAAQPPGLQPGSGPPPASAAGPADRPTGSAVQPQPQQPPATARPASNTTAPGLAATSAPAMAPPGLQTTPASTA